MTAIPSQTEAGVNLKNGNYYITYTDIVIAGRHDLEIERTYNSRSGGKGIFGIGWGSDYETSLAVQGDGTVVIRENGSGARTVFRPPSLSKEEIESAVDAIIQAANQDNRFSNDRERRDERNKLLRDAEFRSNAWTRYVEKGCSNHATFLSGLSIEPPLVVNSVYYAHTGFQRSNSSQIDEFDTSGALTRVNLSNGESQHLFPGSRYFCESLFWASKPKQTAKT
ncbi:DUF6531 domain-containing protein [Candidatus Reidiella endopervernicosa]|uniref:DUF6531 domain-containing protein n=1 Tax=Candidatus Reidiella endopervernicosa TaxID=2738883 RepID=A0A6N0HXV3_9GAMM|nr:DUF6531 domain-containing protein [Candidatus Reidiella endopervernicosa]QKQ27172.1 hypothetical protein HUE57_13385 [Candidatus Reidiella endopervernicosa]